MHLSHSSHVKHVSPIEDFPIDMFDKILAVNLKAPWLASKAVLPEMRKRKYGRIINIASVHGLVVREARVGESLALLHLCSAGQHKQERVRCVQARHRGLNQVPRPRDRGLWHHR